MLDNEFCGARMCPVCGESSKVLDSREKPDGSIWRKRICPSCKAKYTTLEKFEKILRGPIYRGQTKNFPVK